MGAGMPGGGLRWSGVVTHRWPAVLRMLSATTRTAARAAIDEVFIVAKKWG